MTLRQNVRNFLLPLTLQQMQVELDISVEMGDTARAGYVKEFMREVEADFDGCDENSYIAGF